MFSLFVLLIIALAYLTVSPSMHYISGGKPVSATRLAYMRLTDSHTLIYQLLGSDKNKSTEGSAFSMWGASDWDMKAVVGEKGNLFGVHKAD
ncbi:hypothetical protein YB2330_002705 [Saitoella coloradoensis]